MSHRGQEAVELLQDDLEHNSVVVVEEGAGAVTVELPDGTKAIVHNAIADEPPQDEVEGVAIQLEDGRIGYLYGDTLLQAVSPDLPAPAPARDSFPCAFPNCFKTYTTNHHLKTHVRSHTGQRPHICPDCNKRFTTGYALKSHRRTHTGEKPYQCPEDQCAKCFKTSGDLQKHVRTHTGERPFKCEVCGKSFTTSNIRKVHMRVHTGEKPYQCQHEGCGRKFASATNHRNHCRIHTGEKPYVCSVKNCGRRFTEYSSLYKHHLVHNEVKRFHCNLCGRFYRQPSTLAVHRRTVHGLVEGTAEEQPVVWVSNNLEVDLLAEEEAAGTSPSTLIHLPPSIVKKEEEEVVEGNLLGLEEDCISLPTVQVTSLGHTSRPTTSLELEASGNGHILVFTHHLESLQDLETVGTDGDQEANLANTVEVIKLNDFPAVAESTVTDSLCTKPMSDQKRKIILIKEVNGNKTKKVEQC